MSRRPPRTGGGGRPGPAIERFRAKYHHEPSGCWRWTGALQTNGYGSFSVKSITILAHRWSYQHHRGPIPDGLTLDHLCRNRWCVNPQHLEAVTSAENTRRGESPFGQNARKTACKRGHEFTPENTREEPDGRRVCRECHRAYDRGYQRRRYRKANPVVQRASRYDREAAR